ncbi:hypothetical protein [Paracoccus sanguinis]|uniref:GIY-YIG domain-containing protein n=1 Tax=Paracoccus sanguinis TaxID=1545044 RepID=A0A1H2U146_9RHOB|nr:hypothetical protein [Paracoccus sanguinis]SDW49124.1 hypothetical protein SAMN05444276_1011126 [Paracoccus sanguinis]
MNLPDALCRDGTNPSQPGIYVWYVDGTPFYVGQCNSIGKRRRQYVRNITNLHAGAPYRKSKPGGYRHIHKALAAALTCGATIELHFVHNEPVKAERNKAERWWQHELSLRGKP